MDEYRAAREANADIDPPRFEIEFPTWLGQQRHMLGLPEGFALRILDLPGLRSLEDAGNAHVIRQEVGKALCIVTYNSEETDPDKRRRLLTEVVEQVKTLRGSPARMLFALNRIDAFRRDAEWPATEHEFFDRTRDDIRREIARQMPEFAAIAGELDVHRLSSDPAYCAVRGANDPSWAVRGAERIERHYASLVPSDILEDLPRAVARWTEHDRARVFAATIESSYASAFVDALQQHVARNLPQLLLPQHLAKIAQFGGRVAGSLDARANARLNAGEENFRLEAARLEAIGKRLAQVRDVTGSRLSPLRGLTRLGSPQAAQGDLIVALTNAANETTISCGLEKDALHPLYDWSKQIGDYVGNLFFHVSQAVVSGRELEPDTLATLLLTHSEQSALQAGLESLRASGYIGDIAERGRKLEGNDDATLMRIKGLNSALNAFADTLTGILRVRLESESAKGQDRVVAAVNKMFVHVAEMISSAAREVCGGIVALNLPAIHVASVSKTIELDFSLISGFPSVSTKESYQSGMRSVKVRSERRFYTLFLYSHDVYEDQPVYAERDVHTAVIPSIEHVLEGFTRQLGARRLDHVFVRWLAQEIDSFLARIATHQDGILSEYRVLLEGERQRAEEVLQVERDRLVLFRTEVEQLEGRLGTIAGFAFGPFDA